RNERLLDLDQPADGYEVLVCVVGKLRKHIRIDDEGRLRADQQGVAVRRRTCDELRGDLIGCSGSILDDHLLAEIFGEPRADGACDEISAPAWRGRHNQHDAFGRKLLRHGGNGSAESKRECTKAAKPSPHQCLLPFPWPAPALFFTPDTPDITE